MQGTAERIVTAAAGECSRKVTELLPDDRADEGVMRSEVIFLSRINGVRATNRGMSGQRWVTCFAVIRASSHNTPVRGSKRCCSHVECARNPLHK